jgi:hypothetical protein
LVVSLIPTRAAIEIEEREAFSRYQLEQRKLAVWARGELVSLPYCSEAQRDKILDYFPTPRAITENESFGQRTHRRRHWGGNPQGRNSVVSLAI